MKLVYAGTPEFAVPPLAALALSRHEVCLVITQPDRPAGRGRKAIAPPVKELALARGLRVIQPESINKPEAVEEISRLKPDALMVVAYGKILTRRVLELPRLGGYNIHASLLPKYRGAAPIVHAILNGERTTGITVQRIALDVDSGPILAQYPVEIGPEETAGELSQRLSELAGRVIVEHMDAVEGGATSPQHQDAQDVTLAPKLSKGDGLIPWARRSQRVCDFIRAMTPWPGAFTYHGAEEDRNRLIVLAARSAPNPAAQTQPGEVVRTDGELIVAAGEGAVMLLRLKPPGRNVMDASAFLRGHTVRVGDRFRGAP